MSRNEDFRNIADVLYYDGSCPVCSKVLRKIGIFDKRSELRPVTHLKWEISYKVYVAYKDTSLAELKEGSPLITSV